MMDEQDNHFIYICKKLPGADLVSDEHFEACMIELEREWG
jgi:hypothetical protein